MDRREYQRKWIANRRYEFFKDKNCVNCLSTVDLQLHHINPQEKESHRIWSWTKERRIAEIAKCKVLCKDCHKDEHRSKSTPEHGTQSMYKYYKCRCELCRQAKRDSRKGEGLVRQSVKP